MSKDPLYWDADYPDTNEANEAVADAYRRSMKGAPGRDPIDRLPVSFQVTHLRVAKAVLRAVKSGHLRPEELWSAGE